MSKPFTIKQQSLMGEGDMRTQLLEAEVKRAFGLIKGLIETKRHTYIVSPPGAGKTFTVQTVIDRNPKIKVIKIQGVSSMSSFVIRIATAVYSLKPNESLIVWIDDCDSFFRDRESLSIMKGVLDNDQNVLGYGKNLTTQIMMYEKSGASNDAFKAAALRSFQQPGSVGVEVPTDQLRFIVTSNYQLASPNSLIGKRVRQTLIDESTIQDRVNYFPIDLTWEESWGWVASVLMKVNVLGLDRDLSKANKQILLDFMYTNWSRMRSTSMRKVRDMAATMVNFPKTYTTMWTMDLMP